MEYVGLWLRLLPFEGLIYMGGWIRSVVWITCASLIKDAHMRTLSILMHQGPIFSTELNSYVLSVCFALTVSVSTTNDHLHDIQI